MTQGRALQRLQKLAVWLCNPFAIIIYALMLPTMQGWLGGMLNSFIYMFDPWDGSWSGSSIVQDVLWGGAAILEQMVGLIAIPLLANELMGERRQSFVKLLRRGWLWSLGAAVLCRIATTIPIGIINMTGLYTNEPVMAVASTLGLLPLAVKLLAVILLTGRLLLGDQDRPMRRLAWNKVSCGLLALAILLPITFYSADAIVADAQRAAWEEQQVEQQQSQKLLNEKYGVELPSLELAELLANFRTYGISREIWTLVNAANALVLVLLSCKLAGGSFARAPKPEEELEPILMGEEQVRGQQLFKKLLVSLVVLDLVSRVTMFAIGADNGIGIDSAIILWLICYYLYRGRRWARGVWFFYCGMSMLGIGMVILFTMLGVLGSVKYTLLWIAPPVLGVAFIILLSIVTYNIWSTKSPISGYLIHCSISPPTPEERAMDKRVKRLAVAFITIMAILVAVALLPLLL